jgi:two-component system, NtrC family, nitrogen regulation response regulator GlnG
MRIRDSAANEGAPLNELIARRVVEMIDSNGSEARDLYQKMVCEIERPLIELALERARGNQVHAARILGLNRNTLRKKITEHRIVPHKAPPG